MHYRAIFKYACFVSVGRLCCRVLAHISRGVCKTRNPPGTYRNHPEPPGTFTENQNNKNRIKVIKIQNENNKTKKNEIKISSFHLKKNKDGRWLTECLPCRRSKCKDKYFDSTPRALCKSAREPPHFFNSTMSEAKEAIIREDGSQGDDTEELYQSVFTKTEETRFLKNMLTNLRRGFIPFNLTSFPRRKKSPEKKRRGQVH